MAGLPTEEQISRLQGFYRVQARIYDWSRWCFLFGRRQLLRRISAEMTPRSVLEVGCGTGANLKYLAQRFPAASLTGVDLSPDMLRVAERKLRLWRDRLILHNSSFGNDFSLEQRPDLVLFSYSLSMMNPGWDAALDRAGVLLSDGGMIAVVDFDDTPVTAYRRHMASYHVRLDGHLLPALSRRFNHVFLRQQNAYAGLWRYFMYIGRV